VLGPDDPEGAGGMNARGGGGAVSRRARHLWSQAKHWNVTVLALVPVMTETALPRPLRQCGHIGGVNSGMATSELWKTATDRDAGP
jgi:hypothetical protein